MTHVALPAAGKTTLTAHLPGLAPRRLDVAVTRTTRDVTVGGR